MPVITASAAYLRVFMVIVKELKVMYHVRCTDVVNKTKSTTGKNKWLLMMILLNQPLSV